MAEHAGGAEEQRDNTDDGGNQARSGAARGHHGIHHFRRAFTEHALERVMDLLTGGVGPEGQPDDSDDDGQQRTDGKMRAQIRNGPTRRIGQTHVE